MLMSSRPRRTAAVDPRFEPQRIDIATDEIEIDVVKLGIDRREYHTEPAAELSFIPRDNRFPRESGGPKASRFQCDRQEIR